MYLVFLPTAAVIGFIRTGYDVDENDGTVTVEVRVLEGELNSEVEVELTTQDGEATSKKKEILVF